MTQSIAPKSDQLNADDLMSGPVTVTIREVTEGAAEQPFDFHLVEYPGRAYRPSKSMRRVIVTAWGKETTNYTGHQLTLYRNPETMFGRDKTGGIEISHASHIDKPITLALTKTRGKRAAFKVSPLAAVAPAPQRDWIADLAAAGTDIAAIAALGNAAIAAHATQDVLEVIRARHGEIKAGNA